MAYDSEDIGLDAGSYESPKLGRDTSAIGSAPGFSGSPQRGFQPKLDLSPESNDRIDTDWKDPIGASYCQEDYGDVGMNPLNEPVPAGKGKYPENGWMTVASDITPTSSGPGSGTSDSEKR